jgi:CubicO group peptidase (beta-lactamase class C family)
MMTNTGGYLEGGGFDTPEAHAAVIPANGGVTNARALARMYAVLACGGALGDVRLVGRDTLARMARVVSAGRDASLLIPTRFSAGFMSSMDNRREPDGAQETILIGRGAFGHSGAGGSIGFADPAARMSFAYTMNKMGSHGFLNPRGQDLVDAVYRTLGYASNASGEWV